MGAILLIKTRACNAEQRGIPERGKYVSELFTGCSHKKKRGEKKEEW
jgi:hypothetical protein